MWNSLKYSKIYIFTQPPSKIGILHCLRTVCLRKTNCFFSIGVSNVRIGRGLIRQMFNLIRIAIIIHKPNTMKLLRRQIRAELNMHSTMELSTGSRRSVAENEPTWWVSETYPLECCHFANKSQHQIPRLKSASEVYKFRLSKNGKLTWRWAEVFAAAGRILQIRQRLRRPQFFRQIFGGSKNAADPDIRRRLESLTPGGVILKKSAVYAQLTRVPDRDRQTQCLI